jgi:predicted O-methyltransferase YrrM
MSSASVFKVLPDLLYHYFRKKRAIKRALDCQGWTGKKKLSMLYDVAVRTSTLEGEILEIGSAWGRSAILLGYASSKKIWSIDPHTGGRAYIERGEAQNSFETFKINVAKNRFEERIIVCKQTTENVVKKKLLPDSLRFSMIFIDGLHTAGGVEIDFEMAFERMVPGGIMVFDDYFETSIPDYTEMIDALMRRHGLELFRDVDSRLVYFEKSPF